MHVVVSVASLLGVLAVSAVWHLKGPGTFGARPLADDALLALIKNDLAAFDRFVAAGGDVHGVLPAIDGKTYTVAEGLSYFERTEFARNLVARKISFVKQDPAAPYDIMTLAVRKNNPDHLKVLAAAGPDFALPYGTNGWTLLHMASAWCSHAIVGELTVRGKLSWNSRAKDGATPLTLAAEHECLPLLAHWKEHGADFRDRDGRGKRALAILRSKRGAALAAFAQSFEERKVSSVAVVKAEAAVPDFYKKRKIPKEQVVDHAAMLEPEDRPLEATETAEYSEFAD
jgi:hypothetical protein